MPLKMHKVLAAAAFLALVATSAAAAATHEGEEVAVEDPTETLAAREAVVRRADCETRGFDAQALDCRLCADLTAFLAHATEGKDGKEKAARAVEADCRACCADFELAAREDAAVQAQHPRAALEVCKRRLERYPKVSNFVLNRAPQEHPQLEISVRKSSSVLWGPARSLTDVLDAAPVRHRTQAAPRVLRRGRRQAGGDQVLNDALTVEYGRRGGADGLVVVVAGQQLAAVALATGTKTPFQSSSALSCVRRRVSRKVNASKRTWRRKRRRKRRGRGESWRSKFTLTRPRRPQLEAARSLSLNMLRESPRALLARLGLSCRTDRRRSEGRDASLVLLGRA